MSSESSSKTSITIALALLALVAVANGFYSYRTAKSERNVEAMIVDQNKALDRSVADLNQALASNKEIVTDLRGEMSFTKDRLGSTQVELRHAQQNAAQIARQQKEASTKWGSELSQLHDQQSATVGMVGNISTDVAGVKTGLNSTNEQLNSTRSDLQRAIGDLGVQSGLIARNGTELDQLKALGERNYVEFDITKTKDSRRVGTVAISLKKTDPKRQKFTITVVSDDRTVEKKDKTANEPVQFYQAGYRQPVELVVNQIYKDRIVGYIAIPKQKEPRNGTAVSDAGSGNGKSAG